LLLLCCTASGCMLASLATLTSVCVPVCAVVVVLQRPGRSARTRHSADDRWFPIAQVCKGRQSRYGAQKTKSTQPTRGNREARGAMRVGEQGQRRPETRVPALKFGSSSDLGSKPVTSAAISLSTQALLCAMYVLTPYFASVLLLLLLFRPPCVQVSACTSCRPTCWR
jgi:hypothetical protein